MDEIKKSRRGNPAFKKGMKRVPGSGRAKGTQNKVTLAFREALQVAFDQTGGAEAMAKWGRLKSNRRPFYEMCTKLIPLQVTGDNFGPLLMEHRNALSDKILEETAAQRGNGHDKSGALEAPDGEAH